MRSSIRAVLLATLGAVVAALFLFGLVGEPGSRPAGAVPTRSRGQAAAVTSLLPAAIASAIVPERRAARIDAPKARSAPVDASATEAEVSLLLRDDRGLPLESPALVYTRTVTREPDGTLETPAIDGYGRVAIAPGEVARLRVPAGTALAFTVETDPLDHEAFAMGLQAFMSLGCFWTIHPLGPEQDLVLRPGETLLVTGVVPRGAKLVMRALGAPPELDVKIHLASRGGTCGSHRRAGVPFMALVRPGHASVRFTCPGFDTVDCELDVVSGQEVELTPTLVRSTARVVGRVVDEQSRAVAKARVWPSGLDGDVRATTTAADGSFVLWLDRGATTLLVSLAGHVTTQVKGELGAVPWVVTVPLRVAGALELVALDVTGKPLSGADVRLRGDPRTTPDLDVLDPYEGSYEREKSGGGSWGRLRRERGFELEGATSAKGVVRLSRVPPGRYEVGLGDGDWRAVEVRAGGVTRVVLTLAE